ncbi:unnamed protein product [Rotaria magnacalcarata]|uniref:Protein-serine/threonine phosphatase n=1 Tax=Rotaria magnacalcarata TaxID=392030 RepID=A0A816EL60_9BILA|nr:unnamed protein product [Rotaria magnacalcarata]CAF4500817.1 unnamed protein product [Rotaria magnacalcarata]CAF4814529.1 unnamed protein product [Rotaria magnacalcarata]
MPATNIRQYFDQANEFLHSCKNKNERVLIHCQLGISRSSSIVLAYLLKYHYDTVHEAYAHLVAQRRAAVSNYDFFLQLIRYENDLQYEKNLATNTDSTKPACTENQSLLDTWVLPCNTIVIRLTLKIHLRKNRIILFKKYSFMFEN